MNSFMLKDKVHSVKLLNCVVVVVVVVVNLGK